AGNGGHDAVLADPHICAGALLGHRPRRLLDLFLILWPGPCVESLCPALRPALCPVHYRACRRVCL
ncbi:hypothetical protein HPB47_011286, partial [Ixodes persulcatus]